jgi:hypothetical protein
LILLLMARAAGTSSCRCQTNRGVSPWACVTQTGNDAASEAAPRAMPDLIADRLECRHLDVSPTTSE